MAGRVTSPRLVGRSAELGVLRSALDAATGTGSVTVLVAGEAGLGKTRLLAEFTQDAAGTGARVLTGACVALGADGLPYAPFSHALATVASDLGPGALAELVGPARTELARLLPELSRADDPAPVAGTDRGVLFAAVLRTLESLAAAAPVVLVLEDLHWADRSSLELLAYLVGRVRGSLLLVVTYRSDEIHRRHPLRPLLAEAARWSQVRRVDLRPLSPAEIAEQVAAILDTDPPPDVVAAVVDRAEGNPFFAEELLAAGARTELPPGLADVLATRLDALPEAAHQVVSLAAVGGPRVRHELLAAAGEAGGVDVAGGLREAVSHNVLVADRAGSYSFRHALLQEVAYDGLLPAERAELHDAYAAALQDHPEWSATARSGPGELARHRLAAGHPARALGPCLAAADAAAAAYAYVEALALYEQVLALWERVPSGEALAGCDRPAVLARAADTAFLAGALARAVTLVRTALTETDAGLDATRAALLQERLARLLWISGDGEGSLAAIRSAVALVPATPSVERARILGSEARTLMLSGRYAESRARAEVAREVARAAGARREEGDILSTLGVALGRTGRVAEAVPLLERAVALADEAGTGDDVARAYNNLSTMLDDAAGQPWRAAEVGLAGAQRLQDLGYPNGVLHLRVGAAMILLDLGEWERVEELAAEALGHPVANIAWRGTYVSGTLALRRGDLATARDRLAQVRRLTAASLDADNHTISAVVLAELELTEGLPDRALAVVSETLDLLGAVDGPDAVRVLVATALRAVADLRADPSRRGRRDEDDARLLEQAQLMFDRAVGTRSAEPPTLLGDALDALYRAEWSRVTGTPDATAWARTAQAWLRFPRPYEAAYAQWRLAEAHLSAGDKDAAAVALRDAYAAASALGAGPLREQVEALGRRARLRLTAAPPRTSDPTALTEREQEVLELVAAGHTNRQIATALFMSEKTASVHVSRILTKLGVGNRSQAAAVAHRDGLLPGRSAG